MGRRHQPKRAGCAVNQQYDLVIAYLLERYVSAGDYTFDVEIDEANRLQPVGRTDFDAGGRAR